MAGRRYRSRVALTLACAVATLTACGGGGGGGGTATLPTPAPVAPPVSPPPPPLPPPPPPPPAAGPARFETPEYFLSGGIAALNASAAYDRGATGQGITVAVVDTGIDTQNPEFAGAVSAASINIRTGNQTGLREQSEHGTGISAAIGARRNGTGLQGVAYDSTILAIRADNPDFRAQSPAECRFGCFTNTDLAAALDYAVAQNARIVNLSLGGGDTSAILNGAIARATAAGLLVVASAGNGTPPSANPEQPASFATDPSVRGRVIAVGAVDATNQIAAFSNRAGVAAAYFLVAPGVSITTATLNNGLAVVNGTSISTPFVTGAAAVVWSATPFLRADQVASILLESATDLGAPGTDAVYGRGLVNLARALQPLGTSFIPTSTGTTLPLEGTGLRTGTAFGHALAAAPGLRDAVFLDGFGRPFPARLDRRVLAEPDRESGIADWLTPAFTAPVSADLSLTGIGSLHLTAAVPALDRPRPDRGWPGDTARPASRRLAERADDAALDVRLRLSGGAELGFLSGHDPGSALGLTGTAGLRAAGTPADEALSTPYLGFARGGSVALGSIPLPAGLSLRLALAQSEEGERRLARTSQDRVTIGVAELSGRAGPLSLGLQMGSTTEQDRILRSQGDGALSLGEAAETGFVAGHLALELAGLTLFGTAAFGETRVEESAASLLVTGGRIGTTSLAAGVAGGDVWAGGDRLSLTLSRPLRVTSGSARLTVPVGRSVDGEILFRESRTSLVPDGAETRLDLGYGLALAGGSLEMAGHVRVQPDHVADAAPAYGVAARYRVRF